MDFVPSDTDKLYVAVDPPAQGQHAPVRRRTESFNKSPLDDETLLSGQFWGELRVFLAVAKTKSFNRAAEITNTSQPTVSRQVKRLQDVVGSQLFISTPRGVKLTQKGEALAKALVPARSHALFDHQRLEGGDAARRRHRARQHHRRIERAVCRACAAASSPSSIRKFSCI